MNIIVKPKESNFCYCRPDTTWERENKDYYVPEKIDAVFWTPIMFARISKAGKCINPKYASRYYDSFSFGALLYAGEGETAFTSCADHTSILPSPLYNTIVMEGEGNECIMFRNGLAIFRGTPQKDLIEDAICKASEMTSVRIGDYVACELDIKRLLANREEGRVRLEGKFCENCIYDFNIIF